MDSIQYFKQNDQVLWRYLLIWAREGLSIPKALHINVWEMVGVTAMAAGGEQTQSAHAGDVSLGARIDTIICHNSRILLSHGYSPLWLWLQHNLIISWVNTSKLWTAYDAGLKKNKAIEIIGAIFILHLNFLDAPEVYFWYLWACANGQPWLAESSQWQRIRLATIYRLLPKTQRPRCDWPISL